MKEYIEIFCSNDEEEITQVKSSFERNGIEYNVSINNTDNVIFGISPLSNTRDLSYKYQMQVIESDLDTAENIIKELLLINDETEDEIPDINNIYEPDNEQYVAKKEIPNIGRSILLLLVFWHFARFFDFVSKNIKTKKSRLLLYSIGVFVILLTISLSSFYYMQWFGPIEGLLGSVLLIAIFQFFINLIDYIITRNEVQGYTWLILLGSIIVLIIGMVALPRSS